MLLLQVSVVLIVINKTWKSVFKSQRQRFVKRVEVAIRFVNVKLFGFTISKLEPNDFATRARTEVFVRAAVKI